MDQNRVSIIPQNSYKKTEIITKLMAYFNQNELTFEKKTILLKPSFVLPNKKTEQKLSTNTHNNLIAALCEVLYRLNAKRIFIAEHNIVGPARYSFYMVKIKEAIGEIPIAEMCYLDEKETINVKIEDSSILNYNVEYPKILLDGTVDFFFSLPKLKTNLYTEVSLSIKNNLGLITKKERLKYHDDRLHEHLANLYSIRPPDLVIADAIIAGEGQGPQKTSKVNTNMLIIGNKALSVDVVCCYLMGVDPLTIKYLKLVKKKGNGRLDIEQINVINREYLNRKKKNFKSPEINLKINPKITLYQGKQVCKEGCLGMLRGALDNFNNPQKWGKINKLNLIVGKDINLTRLELKQLKKDETIVFGDCAAKYKDYGIFIKGCPPEYIYTSQKMGIQGPFGTDPTFKDFSLWNFIKSYFIHGLQKLFKF